MARKRLSIFHKVSNIFRTSIVVAKMKKPIISKLVFLKKSRKLKRLKLLKHYSYGFLEEYEFSPSSTPLIHGHEKPGGGGILEYRLSMDSLPATIANGGCSEPSDLTDEEDSVDQRAERFIERFYQEMRLQRQELI
ncbi:cotton fiber protein [Salix suchowensis]|nr:cotton fiber protein [Salix suchowensis]